MKWGKYILGAAIVAAVVHFAAIIAVPRVLMHVAMERFGEGGANAWHLSERVTVATQKIVRSTPDFAYSACVYDLSAGPVVISAAPWDQYWSLSLYGDNTDNFFVIDDREAHYGAEITLVKRGSPHPEEDDCYAGSYCQFQAQRLGDRLLQTHGAALCGRWQWRGSR